MKLSPYLNRKVELSLDTMCRMYTLTGVSYVKEACLSKYKIEDEGEGDVWCRGCVGGNRRLAGGATSH